MLLDFRILGDVKENGLTKTQVMTFTIPIAETEALKRSFSYGPAIRFRHFDRPLCHSEPVEDRHRSDRLGRTPAACS
jgi:hypothetical protein